MRTSSELSRRILESIFVRSAMTRTDLVTLFKLRPATIYECINQLKERKILLEPERKTKRTGRKAPLIQINGDFGTYLGIEVRHDQIILASLNARGERLETLTEPLGARPSANKVQETIQRVLAKIIKLAAKKKLEIRAIGIADPGVVDMNQGISLRAINIQGWEGVRMHDWIQKQLPVPTHLFSANNARAFMEYLSIPYPRPQSLLHLELDYGIGAGFIQAEELFLGFNGCAMEIGHVVVEENGPYCLCGNRGCLEAVIGKNGLQRRVSELLSQKVQTALRTDQFSYETLAKAIQSHDRAAHGILMEVIHFLAIGLASTITILNPQKIILSGGLTQVGDKMIQILQQQLSLRCLPQSLKNIEVKISTLNHHAPACGAAMLVLRNDLLEISPTRGTISEKK